jgi:hypothetical protein
MSTAVQGFDEQALREWLKIAQHGVNHQNLKKPKPGTPEPPPSESGQTEAHGHGSRSSSTEQQVVVPKSKTQWTAKSVGLAVLIAVLGLATSALIIWTCVSFGKSSKKPGPLPGPDPPLSDAVNNNNNRQ